LSGIKVNVTTSLHGLEGLKGQTVINSVDVAGGTSAGINLGIERTPLIDLLLQKRIF
jgi:hypothetical protein